MKNPITFLQNIPVEMKEARRWLLWRSIRDPNPTKKPRKVPFYTDGTPRNGKLDTPMDLAKLATFKEALRTFQSGKYAGIGIALGPDGTGQFWQGIDFDNLSEHPELVEMIEKLPGYREVSPSGNGVHAIGYGRSFKSLGSNGTGIEAYASGRYFTVTGREGNGKLACLADFVEQPLTPMHGGKSSRTTLPHALEAGVVLSDETHANLRSALMSLPADDRELWVRMGHALKTLGDVGYKLWLEWSATSEKFDPHADCKTWESFQPTRTGYKAVFVEARKRGWSNPRKEKISPVTRLIEMGQESLLFHCPQKNAYAEIISAEILRILPLASQEYRDFLSHEFFKRTGRGINGTALSDAVNTLEAMAKYEGPEYPVYLRVAHLGDKIYIDIGCDQWRVIEITVKCWKVLKKSPVKFYRKCGMEALPEPKKSGQVDYLKDYINVSDKDFPLLVVWLLAVIGGVKPYPILILQGEQGTGKSTACRIIRALTDPSAVPLRSLSKDVKDLLISASNCHLVVLDNLSGLSPEMSDALCRLSTGGGIDVRALYTDNEQFLADIQRPVLINGIDEIASRPDLSERCLRLELPFIQSTNRCNEKHFWEDFDIEKSEIWGALLNGLVGALAHRETTILEKLPRMADFALWGTAAEKGLGWRPGTFMTAYDENQNCLREENVEASPVGMGIIDLVEKQGDWTGSPTQLLVALNKISFDRTTSRAWPQSTKGLSNCINRLAPNLRGLGIIIEKCRNGKSRIYSVKKLRL